MSDPMPGPRPETPDTLALYVHWPFCLAKCPYCDFNSHVRDTIDQARWRRALTADLDHAAGETGKRCLTSIFFGGGTPSLMDPATVAAVIDRAAARWDMDGDPEITLEANPTSVEAARLRDYRTAGVNRVSMGVQALDDRALKFLGRQHSAKEALAAVDTARDVFSRYSFDLIYARPDQSPADWRAELTRAMDHAGDHLSVYQLTIEPGTSFHAAHRRGDLTVPDEETGAALYEATQEILSDAGLAAYEISNHARPGAESRHNLTYWRYGDYAGIGPGAHGRLSLGGETIATDQTRSPEAWLDRVERDGSGRHRGETLSWAERRDELVLMGLRLRDGIRRTDVHQRLGAPIEALFDGLAIADLRKGGLITLDETGLRATSNGLQRLNGVIAHLMRDAPSSN